MERSGTDSRPFILGLPVVLEVDSEAGLIAAARGGDRDAFGALVRRYEQRVFRLAGRFFHQRADLEEAAQESFLRAWSRLASYRADAPFEHWLVRVTLRCCYDLLRKRREDSLEDIAEPSIPSRGDAVETRIDIRRVLAKIAPKDRFVLLLLDGEGWSVQEIAEKLGWTSVNVKVRAHRARRRLRDMLEKEGVR